jgi:hypothetical protein
MKSTTAKSVFSIFLFLTFLAGWYFYVTNPKTMYMEYIENMENQEQSLQPVPEQSLQPVPEQSLQPVPEQSLQPVPEQSLQPVQHQNQKKNPVMVQDASRENTSYNTNMYAGFDPTSQYVGVYTNIDEIHASTSYSELSENPMDSNWGGVYYTKDAVDSGKYKDDEVLPYGNDPARGIGMSTSIHNGSIKNIFA